MTPAETKSLRTGITGGLLWGGVVVVATGYKPAGLAIAAAVAIASVLFSTGWRLPADGLRTLASWLWVGAKSSTGVLSASVPVKRVVPLLLLTAMAGRGCDGVTLPDVKWPDIEWHNVLPIVTPVDPSPVPSDGYRILIVEEATEDRVKLQASQQLIFTAKAIRDYAKDHCVTDGFRILDDDADMKLEASVWQEAMKVPRVSLPWLLVTNGKSGFSGPLPQTVDETLSILKKYGGE